MFRAILGQGVGVVSIGLWLPLTVYFMSRASEPNVTDAGNWFLAFAVLNIVFIAIMAYWRRFFAHE